MEKESRKRRRKESAGGKKEEERKPGFVALERDETLYDVQRENKQEKQEENLKRRKGKRRRVENRRKKKKKGRPTTVSFEGGTLCLHACLHTPPQTKLAWETLRKQAKTVITNNKWDIWKFS